MMLRSMSGLAAAALLLACGGEGAPDDTADTAGAGAQPSVREAWARAAGAGSPGAAYLTIVNPTADTLVVGNITSLDAGPVEAHESTIHDGMAHMAPVPRLVVAPGDSLVMRPGGVHLMLTPGQRPLVAGDSVRLEIDLGGRTTQLAATIRP